MAVALVRELGAVSDQETGVTGELARRLRNDLNDELLGDDLSTRGQALVECVCFAQFSDDAAGVRAFADCNASRERS